MLLTAVGNAGAAPYEPGPGHAPAPLFADASVLSLQIELKFSAICRNPRSGKCTDLPATLYTTNARGERQRLNVKLRTRGRWRRDIADCALPAMFVEFDREQTTGTVFAGQHMLPLTTHCKHNRPRNEGYLLKEFIAYRLYNLVTPNSLQVRLAKIDYQDSGSARHYDRYGFFSEHFDAAARRIGAERFDTVRLDPRQTDATGLAMLSLFQFMISNLDWSVVRGHNIATFRRHDGQVVPMPYDFDYAGIVGAEYAVPPDFVSARSVRKRLYRGFCRPEIDWSLVFARFMEIRPQVLDTVDRLPGLRSGDRKRTRNFLQRFYTNIATDRERHRNIIDVCRPLPEL